MGSNSKTSFTSHFPVIKKIDVGSLRRCVALMGPDETKVFDQTYGNIRRLLQLDVQETALMAFSRFYDHDTRCFFLKNFQLSPTLEEYDQLLGFSRSLARPYQYQGQYYSDERLATVLRIGVDKLKLHKLKRNGVAGYPQEYFEGLMQSYALTKSWGPFRLVLALTMFGVILFPQIERYIDEDAIGVFLAFKDSKNPINPVPAILANTYHALHRYSRFHKENMCLSSHVLYAWLITHIINNKKHVNELISYALSCDVKTRTSAEWLEYLKTLNDQQIRWYHLACWNDKPVVLFSCKDFQNVPLMGTQGCINYNPSLTLRQLGYPMRNSPSDSMLSHVYLYPGIPKCGNLLRRVQDSWESVMRKGSKELSEKTSDIPFSQWLKEKLQNIRSLSQGSLSFEEKVPEPYVPTHKELTETKSALARVEEEKKTWKAKLDEMTLEKERLREENVVKTIALEESMKKLKKEEEDKQEMRKYLQETKDKVKRSNAKVGEAIARANVWRELYDKSLVNERAAKESLTESRRESHLVAELKSQLENLKQERISIEEIFREYQQALKYEREISEEVKRDLRYLEDEYKQVWVESQHWHERFMALLGRIEEQEIVKELRDEIRLWESKFMRLSEQVSQAMVEFPKKLKVAESEILFLNTSPEVSQFMKHCRSLITEFKKQSQKASADKKRKRVDEFKAICN